MSAKDFIENGNEAVNPIPYQESNDQEFYCLNDGLTKREYFAGLAMQGLVTLRGVDCADKDIMAKNCVRAADALLKELEKG